MKNSDIKYDLSTDYDRLYDLLHKGYTVVGFVEFIKNEFSVCGLSSL